MPRRVTVTFADGSSHVYENTPDDVTPQQIVDRATREFSKPVKKLDGGRGMLERGARAVADTVSGAVGAIDNAMQPLREAVGYDPEEQNRKTDELARQIRERQRADLAKQDGILDTAGDLFTRGMAGASAGIERVASGLALNDAERQRFVSRARENEAIAKTGIAGETTWDAATGNLAKMPGFILEKGIESLPYMATAAVGPFGALSNASATTGQIAQSRAEADRRQDASGTDVAIAAPFGTVSTLIDSLSLGAMRNGIGGGLARGIMRDAATEGLTEAVQSGIEYTGGAVGTEQGFDLGEMGSQMLQGGLVGAGVGGGFGVVTEGGKEAFDAAGRIKFRRADDTRSPAPGVREMALNDAVNLTPEDLASPLDNGDIAAGRAEIANATASKKVDAALSQAGLPKVGSKVNVSNLPGGRSMAGTIEDVFSDDTGTGVVVRPEGGGKPMREYLDTLNELGVSITPSDALAEADAIDAALAAQASAPTEVSSPLPSAGAETPSPRPSGRTPSKAAGGGVNSAIVEGLKKRGFSEGQALGIAAGIHAESASNPNAKNPTSGAMGLGQWLGPRKDAIRKRFGDNPTLDQQLDFLADELRGGDAGGKYVLAQNDPAKVLDAYVRKFMRPAAGAETDGDIARGMAALGQVPTDASPLVPESTTQFADRPQRETPSVEVTAAAPDLPTGGDMAGPAIDKEWTAFAPDSGTIGIPRAEMPQVKAEHRGAMVNFLNARGISHAEEEVAADTLKPSQAEFSPSKVEKAKSYEGGNRAILISADGYVVDGHHQWLAARDNGETVRAIRLDAPIREVLQAAHEFPSSETADGATSTNTAGPQDGGVAATVEAPKAGGSEATATDSAASAGGAVTPARVEDTGTGKSVAVIGANEAEIAAISAAVPKAMGMKRKDGALVYSKKYADKIRAALAGVTETVTPKSDAKREGMSKDEIVRRRAELLGRAPMAVDEEFADMIARKDYEGLRGILRPDNPKSRAVFAEATGITLPKTQRDTFAALREWAGVSEEQEAQRQKAENDRIKRESDARDREWATNAAESTKMLDENGVETTVRQWIDSKIEQGFDRLENVSNGAVPKWVLLNAQGKGFKLQKDFLRYARIALEGRAPEKLTDEQIAQEEGMSVEDVRASKHLFANGSERIKLAREEGKAAFDRGDERVLPSYLSDMPAGVKEEWYAGWDQANLADPVPDVPANPNTKDSIGTNSKGFPLYEDEDGVRSYVDRGIRITEPVEMRPVRGAGIQTSVDKAARRGEFLTEEERREKMGARPVDRSAAIIMDPAAGTVKTVPLGGKRATDKKANPYVKVGERYTLKQDVDYLSAGGTYVVTSTTRTDAFFENVDTGGRTRVKNYLLQPALGNGVMVPAAESTTATVQPALKPTDQATIDLLTRMAEAEDNGSYVTIEIGSARVKMMVAEGLIIENKGKSDAMWITSEKGRKLLDDAGVPHAQSPKPAPSQNRLVTDERAAELRERLKAKLNPGRLNSGIDPEIIAIGTELAVYHIEKGARRFQAFAKAIAEDLGMKVQDLRLYMRGWYNGARDMMEDAGESVAGMDTPDEVAKSMRTLEQWANEPAVTEGANADTRAVDAELPNRVPASDAGTSPGDVQRTSPVGRDGRAPEQEGSRGSGDVSRTDGGRTDTTGQRSAGGPADGARGDRAGVRDADSLPAGDRDAGSPRKAAAAVKGTDWVIEPGSLDESRSLAQKARDNVEAIALVKQIEREGRQATREEQAVIARYIGWGGLKNIFPDPVTGEFGKGFETLGPRLRELLTDEEYATARQSIQYAHYTSESVVRPMWDIARQLGFRGGSVFEPGMGTGNFRGMMPADIAAASSYSGIEYDHLTASIAKLLYPQSGVRQADYTRMPGIKGAVDLVIGNPPFSETAISSDPDYAKHKFLLHDFFFAKSLDALKPGGLLMFITSAGTMNKVGDKARAYLADRADLVGAIRLPGNAFEQNAGTSVTTDIVILRKRMPGEKPGDMSWVGTQAMSLPDRDGNTVQGNVNRYFVENPQMVLGEQGMFDKLVAGPRYAVRAPKGFNVEEAIRKAAESLPGSVVDTTPPAMAPGFIAPDVDLGSGERKDGSFYLDPDGRLMQFRGGAGRPVQSPGKGVTGGMSAAAQERVRGLIPVKDALREVYAADLKSDGVAGAAAREKLNKAYDAFTKKFGPINKTDISYRRPSRVELEGLRAEAREEARLAGTEWDDGSFDVQSYLDAGAKLTEIAKAREEAREKALADGRIWNEGTFDSNDVPDKVIEKRPNLDPFMEDDEAYRLAAIEHYNKDTGEAAKGRAFFENAITLDQTPKIASANDALLYSLNRFGRPNLREMARIAGKSETALIEELGDRLFETPGKPGSYETGEMYLSGNVREKLAIARAEAERDPAFQRNVRALEAALPAPLTPTEIAANLGMPWLPTKVVQQFATEKLGLRQANVTYLGKLAQWTATGDTTSAAARSDWGTERMDAIKILEAALNRQTPVIRDKIETAQGEKTVVNEVATQAVQDKMAEMKAAFREWVWTDPDRSAALVDLYNREYNSLVAPKFDGSYLTTPGIASGWSWRPHQRAVIARIIQSGNTYMAHEVGAGKTSAMIGSGMEMKRLGLVSKPMYVVPNHMLGQFTKEFYEQYPLARILVADEQRFHTSRRKEFIARMAAEDWDAIIITHSAFGFIPMSDDFTAQMIQDQIDELEDLIAEIGKGQDVRITRRKVEQQKEALSQRLAGLTNRKRDQVFTFEETGVDFLFVDEAHLFRKLDFSTKMGNVKGIDPAGSQMSFDLYAKTRFLEGRQPGRNLVLASGTPITNTMAELFSVSRYLQQGELEKRGLGHFDAWAGAFGDTVTALEQDAAGGYKPVTRFAQFVNVPELSVMVRQVMDVVGATELRQYVSLPNLKGGGRNLITVEMTPEQERYKATLQSRMEAIKQRSGPPQKGDDILLSVIGDGRKAAIDYRLIDASAPKESGSKLERMIEEVARRHKEFTRTAFHKPLPGGAGFSEKPETYGPATQMIFSDFGINGDFPVHKYIKSALIERGIPASQIALIQDFKTHIAKQRLFNDMNEGKVRVLIGSVAKMGTGVNAQKRLRALHNMDAQWYPANDTQRNGRIIRQGNMNPEVEILDYATNGTYDSTMWGLMAKKARFIEGFMRGDPTMRDMEDLGEASQYEQASAMTTSDPRIMDLTEWKQELEKIERRQMAHEREQQSVRMRLASARNEVTEQDRLIPLIQSDIQKRQLQEGEEFSVTLKGETFEDRTEYGAALMATMDALVEKSNGRELREGVGEFGGFPLVAEAYPRTGGEMALSFYVKRAGGRETRVDMGTDARGLVTRLTNAIKGFDKDLTYSENRKAEAEQRIADFEPKLGATFDDGGKGDALRTKIRDLEATLKAESEARDAALKAQAAPEAQQSIPEAAPQGARPADIRTALQEQLANLRLADKVKVRLVDTLGGAAGEYRAQIVTIAQDTPQGEVFTLNHEAIHVLRDLGLFNTSEWAILSAKARRETGLMRSIRQRYEAGFRQRGMSGAALEEALIEEAVADMFARHQDGRYKAEGTTDRLFKMLRQFFEAVRNAFAGRGLRTAEGVMQDVADGRVGARNSQEMLDGSARQSVADATGTEAFKRWFGDSKVVDENGKPLVVYHGGHFKASEFRQFDADLTDPTNDLGAGFYFSNDRGDAEGYDYNREYGAPQVIEAYLSMQNPYRVGTSSKPAGATKESGEVFRQAVEAAGYDGIIDNTVGAKFEPEGSGYRAGDGRTHYVVFRPEQVKSAIGNNGAFDPNNPDIRFSIPERDDLVALGGTEPTWKGKVADAFDRWRTAMQDRYLPLLKVQRQIEEQTGKSLPVSRNPYMGEELMTGRIGARLERLAEEHVQPLFDAMHAEKVTTEDLESFLYARHAPERNARIAEINPEFTEGEGSGMTDLEAAAIMSRVRKAGKMEAMERLAKRVDQIRDDALDYRVQTGLISKEEADEWRSTYQFYVPLRGFKETGTDAIPDRMNRSGGGINVRGRESKQAFGRRSQADSPLAYLILQAEEAIIRGETNIVAARFYNLAKANPDKEFWSINKPTVRQRMNEESGLVESYTTYNLLAEDKDWTVSAKINGREVRVTMNKQNVDARRLADAMRNLTQHQLDWVTLHMGKVNRFLSAVNTSYNPEFIITNAFRDLQTATFNLSGEGVKGIVRGTLKDYRKALAASAKGAFGKHSGEWGKWYDEFVMNGGRVYFNKVENVEEIKKRIASAAEMAKAKAGEGGPRLQAKRLFLAGRDMIENLNNGVENAVRLSVYKNAREAGLTPAQAASMAKNVTVNFNRRGTAGPAMNAAYLFFNASVQGSARILMALRSPRVRKMVAGVMIAAAAAEILNAMMSADDDDGESIYDKIPAFEKSRNIILMMPDGKSYIKIPMPYGYNAFWEAGRSAAEIARRGGDRWLETMGQFAGTVADAFNPIGGSDSLLNILSPTITDPIVDLTLNKDFTGKPIMPDQSPYGPEEPDNQRYFNSVGPHWKTITEFLNASTGGDEVQPGAIDVSPETLEYLSGTVIGSAGAFLDRSLGLIGKSMDESEDITADDIPVARKVVGGKPSWVDKSAFYDRLHAVETAMDRTEKYLEAGNQEAAYEYAMDNKAALMLEGAAKQARKDMREVRKARNELEVAKDRDQIDDATYRDKKAIVRRAEELVTTDFNSQWVAVMKARRDESGGD